SSAAWGPLPPSGRTRYRSEPSPTHRRPSISRSTSPGPSVRDPAGRRARERVSTRPATRQTAASATSGTALPPVTGRAFPTGGVGLNWMPSTAPGGDGVMGTREGGGGAGVTVGVGVGLGAGQGRVPTAGPPETDSP